jgi:uncharacterized protein (DUF4213/DUF364 family)
MKTASVNDDYRGIGERIAAVLGKPRVTGLHLPAPVADETFRDEFGFVFLDNEGIGPFYISMQDILPGVSQRYPRPEQCEEDAVYLLQGFASEDPAARALALGTYNALSASLYQAAGFEPPDRTADSGLNRLSSGQRVGMVGYFSPLVDKLTARGCEVVVLERSPERVVERPGVVVTENPQDLAGCRQLLCTASTLINDSLEDVLAASRTGVRFELVGPSGSGLPDPLFARGVTAVGGVSFADRGRLIGHLDGGGSWGDAGRKYQLDANNYPGLEQLISRLAALIPPGS